MASEINGRNKARIYLSSFRHAYHGPSYVSCTTYGQIALLAGNPRWSRVVGYALHVNPDPENVRCYRVVNRFGEVSKAFAFGGENEQIRLLKSEGVEVDENGRVDLKKYGMV